MTSDTKGELHVEGIVEIRNGKNHIMARNKATNALLLTLVNYMVGFRIAHPYNAGSGCLFPCYGFTIPSSGNGYMIPGRDTSVSTTPDMTALQQVVNIKADTATVGVGNPSAGTYDITFTGVWSRGTLSGQIGEIGLFLIAYNTLKAGNWTFTEPNNGGVYNFDAGQAVRMVARLAAADGEFTAFTIDTNEPTVINWTFRFSFA